MSTKERRQVSRKAGEQEGRLAGRQVSR